MKSILVGLLLTTFNCLGLWAQGENPCSSPCSLQTSPYTSTQFTVPITGTCSVTIQYRWRVCEGIYDLEILVMQMNGACAGINASDAANKAIGMLVRDNRMAFPPYAHDPEGVWQWRIYRPACWRTAIPSTLLVPCSSECCLTTVVVEKRAGCTDWMITGAYGRNPRIVCSTTTVPSELGGACMQGCNEVFHLAK